MGDALATTLGQLAVAPEAVALTPAERTEMERWRQRTWTSLERRAGVLAERDPHAWYEALAFERWTESSDTGGLPPAALALFYRLKRLIPRRAQLALRRSLIRRQGPPRFPRWPFDAAGHELLRLAIVDALLEHDVDALRFPWFWPDGARAAVTLTHDVESERGLVDSHTVAEWEERYGFRSSFNVVGDWYPIDMRLVEELRRRGHEIGSHAIHHDRSLFSSRREFERQLPLLERSAEELGAVGFRSPATHRVVEWLADLPFSYDCTMPHSDPYEPIPGGTATVWPFFHGDVVELPYTAPQDHTLFNLLGHRDCTIWKLQLADVLRCSGMLQLLTHPDPDYLGRPATGRAYRDILAAIADRDDVWVALPKDVARWWRQRATGEAPPNDGIATWSADGVALDPVGGSRGTGV
ncbi:MAG TPA: polysaccharide deacetylase family protein [Solirubrobacterales bacterium]